MGGYPLAKCNQMLKTLFNITLFNLAYFVAFLLGVLCDILFHDIVGKGDVFGVVIAGLYYGIFYVFLFVVLSVSDVLLVRANGSKVTGWVVSLGAVALIIFLLADVSSDFLKSPFILPVFALLSIGITHLKYRGITGAVGGKSNPKTPKP